MIRSSRSLPIVLLLGVFAAAACAQSAAEEFAKRKRQALLEAGKRHLELGVWCRNEGLTSQATNEFMAAVEVSENQHPGANKVLALMQSLDERFWKLDRKNPSKKLLDAYEQKEEKAAAADTGDRFKVADWAYKKKLTAEAKTEFLALIRAEDKELTFDKDGRIVLACGVVPKDLSEEIRGSAVVINGKPYLRDEFLALNPDIAVVYEETSKAIRVRSESSLEEAKEFHLLSTALYDILATELGARPTRRLSLFIFAARANYESYLKRAGLGGHVDADGIADPHRFVAVFHTEGFSEERRRAIAVHEMTHHFDHGVSRAVMPSWYVEAFAETFGGDQTFTWDGKTLTTRLPMAARRLAPIKTDAGFIPLKDLTALVALDLIRTNKIEALNFYAEAWAFRRFLLEAAPPEIRDRFRAYEKGCRDAAIGARVGQARSTDESAAVDLFLKGFGADLPKLETAFRAYLQSL